MEYSVVKLLDHHPYSTLPDTLNQTNENQVGKDVAAVEVSGKEIKGTLEYTEDAEKTDSCDSEDESDDDDLDLDDMPVFYSSSRRTTTSIPMSPGYFASTPPVYAHSTPTPGSPLPSFSPHDTTTATPSSFHVNDSTLCLSPAAISKSAKLPAPAQAGASLYIGDLHSDTTEPMLYSIFSACGPISSIRICRDSLTQKSLGYGYINYQNKDSGDRAINELNYINILGRECRVSRAIASQVPGGARKSMPKGGNIYVRNLSSTVDSKLLWNTFKQYGPVLSCKVATNPHTGVSLCRGYVQYEEPADAQNAIQKSNGMILNDQAIKVDIYLSKEERDQSLLQQNNVPAAHGNLKINGLPLNCTEQDLYEIFSPFGDIHSVYFTPHSLHMGSPNRTNHFQGNGWGYVNYNSFKSAVVAKNVVDGYYFHRSCIRVLLLEQSDQKTLSISEDQKIHMVVIRKLAHAMNSMKIIGLLREYTYVDPEELRIQVYRSLPGHAVLSCTIECKSNNTCENIVANLNERRVEGYFLIVYTADTSMVSPNEKQNFFQTLVSPLATPTTAPVLKYTKNNRNPFPSNGGRLNAEKQWKTVQIPHSSHRDEECVDYGTWKDSLYQHNETDTTEKTGGQEEVSDDLKHFRFMDEGNYDSQRDGWHHGLRSTTRRVLRPSPGGSVQRPTRHYQQHRVKNVIYLLHVPRTETLTEESVSEQGRSKLLGYYYSDEGERLIEHRNLSRVDQKFVGSEHPQQEPISTKLMQVPILGYDVDTLPIWKAAVEVASDINNDKKLPPKEPRSATAKNERRRGKRANRVEQRRKKKA